MENFCGFAGRYVVLLGKLSVFVVMLKKTQIWVLAHHVPRVEVDPEPCSQPGLGSGCGGWWLLSTWASPSGLLTSRERVCLPGPLADGGGTMGDLPCVLVG